MLQLLKFLPRLPGISRLSLHTRTMARLTQTNPLLEFIESRVELLASFKPGIENDKYQDLLDTAEKAILYQASKVSVLTCSEAKAIIEILTRHDLFGEPRVNVLAAKILKNSQLMWGGCKPECKETNRRKPFEPVCLKQRQTVCHRSVWGHLVWRPFSMFCSQPFGQDGKVEQHVRSKEQHVRSKE